ncbi:MAG: CHASE3 domain-containing protein [Pseudomonadota bacterium]|nr:CHASE3 domain-containing protein [Pseudomonadota bacterium]
MSVRIVDLLRSSVIAFPLAAIAALGVLIISETSFQQATSSFTVLGDRGQTRIELLTLWRNLNEAETGQRGYLLTGRRDYLAPYTTAVPSVNRILGSLAQVYAAEPEAAAKLARIDAAVNTKLSEMQTTIAAFDEGKPERARELLLSNIGKENMDEAQALTQQLLDRESARIQIDREGVLQTLRINRLGVAAMTAVSLLALFMYLRQSAALDRARILREQAADDERERLEREVNARTLQLRELAQYLQTIREDERSHLARELHDELGALLTAAKLDAARLKSRLGATTPDILERLAHLNEQLNSGIALKRRIIEDLRPSSLSNLGLVAALEILLREFAGRSESAVVERLDPVDLAPRAELTVFRLVQEALTNIAKYAQASEIEVSLQPEGDDLVKVVVRDNGVGFLSENTSSASHGLVGMRYRVEAEGGTMTLSSAPGQGTRIEVTLPRLPLSLPQAESEAPALAAVC